MSLLSPLGNLGELGLLSLFLSLFGLLGSGLSLELFELLGSILSLLGLLLSLSFDFDLLIFSGLDFSSGGSLVFFDAILSFLTGCCGGSSSLSDGSEASVTRMVGMDSLSLAPLAGDARPFRFFNGSLAVLSQYIHGRK